MKYDRTTLGEVDRASVGDDPHVFPHPTSRKLHVACQDTDDVHVLDRDALDALGVIPILGGHCVWVPPHGQTLYVTHFPSHLPGGLPGPGAVGLFAVDLDPDTPLGGLATPYSGPHNLASTDDGHKLYVTHSNGGTKVTVYDLPTPTSVPELLGEIDVGGNPFGIAPMRR